MGVIFNSYPDQSRPVLMDCARRWGEQFVRFSDFVALEYERPSMFMWEGEVISDSIYVNVPEMQSLFEYTAQSQNLLLIGWAQYVAGMLEIATREPWRKQWQAVLPDFQPLFRGVNSDDIPQF